MLCNGNDCVTLLCKLQLILVKQNYTVIRKNVTLLFLSAASNVGG